MSWGYHINTYKNRTAMERWYQQARQGVQTKGKYLFIILTVVFLLVFLTPLLDTEKKKGKREREIERERPDGLMDRYKALARRRPEKDKFLLYVCLTFFILAFR